MSRAKGNKAEDKAADFPSAFGNRLIKLLLGIFFAIFLASCHSPYLNLKIRTDGTVAWNKDRTAFAFIAKTRLYRMPVGISKFPDGGISKTEYQDFSLYLFDIKHKKLTHLINLNEFYLGSAYRWLSISQVALKLQGPSLFYKLIKPYDYNMKYIDEKRYPTFLNDISKTYSINIQTHQKSVVDTTLYEHLFDNKREKLKPSLAKNYLSSLKYSDWGINLKELFPQKKSRYIDYIAERGNENILKAIFEQIVPEFSDKDKKYIIEKMADKKQELLNDYETTSKEKDVYQKSLKKGKYIAYAKYFDDVSKKLNFPTFDNKIANKKKVINRLKKHKINISDDFEFSEVCIIGDGYDAEFKLKNADSKKIEKYKKWFHEKVAELLNNKWTISKQTKFEKPNSEGIVVSDLINFVYEHTELKYKSESSVHFLELKISYDLNSEKKLTFSVSEE